MGLRFNRFVINGRIQYNMFADMGTWDISRYGYEFLLEQGFNAFNNPFVDGEVEEFLLRYGFVRRISTPTIESRTDQLFLELLNDPVIS